jgi:hypothetical protein
MRSIAYAFCATIVGLTALHRPANAALELLDVPVLSPPCEVVLLSIGSLMPAMFKHAALLPLRIALNYFLALLAVRRAWLFLAKKEATPDAFDGLPKFLGYLGLGYLALGVLVFALSMPLKAGFWVIGGMLILPAVFFLPLAFMLTEVLSFRRNVIANEN